MPLFRRVKNKHRRVKTNLHVGGIQCSFCWRMTPEVSRLVSGPSVYICSECASLVVDILEEDRTVFRTFEFPPEFRQAGVSILSYFARVLSKKYPKVKASVKIQQDGPKVRLIVEIEKGMTEAIEQALNTYGQIVIGSTPPTALFSDLLDLRELKQKLELAAVELRGTRELLWLTKTNQETRVHLLEDQVRNFYQLLGTGLGISGRLESVLELLIENNITDQALQEAMELLRQKLTDGAFPVDQEKVEKAAVILAQRRPNVFKKLLDFCQSAAAGTTGRLLADWLLRVEHR